LLRITIGLGISWSVVVAGVLSRSTCLTEKACDLMALSRALGYLGVTRDEFNDWRSQR
jgi:hypothetical protein